MRCTFKKKSTIIVLLQLLLYPVFVAQSFASGVTLTNKYPLNSGEMVHAIGDVYQGGIIFWLSSDTQHGLIAASSDLENNSIWSALGIMAGAIEDGVYKGQLNTITIQSKLIDQNSAAFFVKNYLIQGDGLTPCILNSSTDECFGDWYLPSKFELNLMYQQKTIIGGFLDDYYWSSLEENENNAWGEYFGDGEQKAYSKSMACQVRAIRSF